MVSDEKTDTCSAAELPGDLCMGIIVTADEGDQTTMQRQRQWKQQQQQQQQ